MTATTASPSRRRPRSRRKAQRSAAFARHLLLIATSIIVLLPIGYMILASFKSVPDFFGNPYGLPTDWAFDNYKVVRIFATVFAHNGASMRVLEKSGFIREGTLRRSAVKNGLILDQALYAKVR